MRFQEKEDCYLDTKTGLEWSKENYGPIIWHEVMKRFDGKKEWRLPTIEELVSLVDYTKCDPATELPNMLSSDYWSATTHAYRTDYAWGVGFHYGGDYWCSKSDDDYVRAVRGGR